jgi:hypothetical protein
MMAAAAMWNKEVLPNWETMYVVLSACGWIKQNISNVLFFLINLFFPKPPTSRIVIQYMDPNM